MTQEPVVERSPIPGLLVVRVPLHDDARGWFGENWQRQKMLAAGVPDFQPVQNNVAFSRSRGTTRGFHAEPWDKFVSVVTGRAFGAWVDMRPGPTHGTSFTLELAPGTAVFVPRGVGNAYQTLEDATTYTYLVTDHWRPDTKYAAVHVSDPGINIDWPIPIHDALISDKDLRNPRLSAVSEPESKRVLVLGGGGQVAKALGSIMASAHVVSRSVLDLCDASAMSNWPWHEYSTVVNAAAFTSVDAAEGVGRREAWATNARAVASLAEIANEHRLTVVHYSTDYVFDGVRRTHDEDEPFAPLNVYGQTKAAGDLIMTSVRHHYVLRTSWVFGDGRNFVRTMREMALRGETPSVVDDQFGRPTAAAELAQATAHFLRHRPPAGTYNVTGAGEPRSWADIAEEVFRQTGRDPGDVRRVSTITRPDRAPRPRHSTLELSKLRATGFQPADALQRVGEFLASEDLSVAQ